MVASCSVVRRRVVAPRRGGVIRCDEEQDHTRAQRRRISQHCGRRWLGEPWLFGPGQRLHLPSILVERGDYRFSDCRRHVVVHVPARVGVGQVVGPVDHGLLGDAGEMAKSSPWSADLGAIAACSSGSSTLTTREQLVDLGSSSSAMLELPACLIASPSRMELMAMWREPVVQPWPGQPSLFINDEVRSRPGVGVGVRQVARALASGRPGQVCWITSATQQYIGADAVLMRSRRVAALFQLLLGLLHVELAAAS